MYPDGLQSQSLQYGYQDPLVTEQNQHQLQLLQEKQLSVKNGQKGLPLEDSYPSMIASGANSMEFNYLRGGHLAGIQASGNPSGPSSAMKMNVSIGATAATVSQQQHEWVSSVKEETEVPRETSSSSSSSSSGSSSSSSNSSSRSNRHKLNEIKKKKKKNTQSNNSSAMKESSNLSNLGAGTASAAFAV